MFTLIKTSRFLEKCPAFPFCCSSANSYSCAFSFEIYFSYRWHGLSEMRKQLSIFWHLLRFMIWWGVIESFQKKNPLENLSFFAVSKVGCVTALDVFNAPTLSGSRHYAWVTRNVSVFKSCQCEALKSCQWIQKLSAFASKVSPPLIDKSIILF